MVDDSERTDRLLYIIDDMDMAVALLDDIGKRFTDIFLYVIPNEHGDYELRTNDRDNCYCIPVIVNSEEFEKGWKLGNNQDSGFE